MAETQAGLAIVWAVQGLTFTAGIVTGTSNQQVQSMSLAYDSEKVYVKADTGETVGRVDVDGKLTLTLNVIPCALVAANTKDNANASFHLHIIPPGTLVTIADSTGVATIFEAKSWICNRCSPQKTNSGVAVVEIELERYIVNDISNTVAAS